MSIAQRLANLADGLSAEGVLSAAKGGTGNTTGGGTTSPTVSQISYLGNDTAADPSGGTTITLTGTNFASGAKVLINNTQVSVVTVVSATQITFTAPALAAGSYILYVVNTDGSTAIAVPGIQYSGVPAWSTAAGSLGTSYETGAVSASLSATSDSAVSYSVVTGTLPSGATLNSNGTISGTSPLVSGSTTYTFTVRATDAENQDTDREFSLTVNPDVVSWSSPTNGATLSATPNTAYSSVLTATSAAGSSISYTADSLPAGLAISGSTITGTPTTPGTSTTTLTATAATTSKTAQITINWTINVAADPNFKYNTLLLNAETVAVPFVADASANNFALTSFGDTKPSSFNPYTPGYYSNYFDGTGDYLSIPASSALSFAADFTIECWVNTSTTSLDPYGRRLWSFGSGAAFYLDAVFYDGGSATSNICIEIASIGIVITGTIPVADGRWHHVALSRSGSSMKLFVDGVQSGSTYTTSSAFTAGATNGMFLGCLGAGVGGFLLGSISNFRVNNTTGLYTTTFTPSTTPLTAVSGTGLLTCQANRLIDSSTSANAVTRNGDVKISSFIPFVPNSSYATYGSTYFDGSGDWLTGPTAASNQLTGDFTIEAWAYPTTIGSQMGIFSITNTSSSGSNGLAVYFDTSNKLSFWVNGNGGTTTTSAAYTANTWYHIALVRSGSTNTLYVNGISSASNSNTPTWPATPTVSIGKLYNDNTSYLMTGYITDARIIKGTAVYTTNFTPPATPLTAVTNTSLLTCQTNQPVTNSVFLDNSTNALAITRQGNATQGSFSPYGANWSNYFDGSGDYLSPSGRAEIASGEFTIEAWVFPTAYNTPTNFIISDNNWSVGQNGGYRFYIKSDGKLELAASTTTWNSYPVVLTSTSTVPLNKWSHVAITRNSSNVIRCFINGVQDATSVTYSSPLNQSTAYEPVTQIGAVIADGGVYDVFTGYISNLRVINGTGGCLYTSAFTPPTEPLTAVAGTRLLTCQSPNLVDNSLNAYTITKNGDVRVERFSPFAPTMQTPLSHSVYFDGSGDYTTVAGSTGLDFSTGDFTVEAWINRTAYTSGRQNPIIGRSDSGFTLSVLQNQADTGTTNQGKIGITVSDTVIAFGTTVTQANTWYHVAVSRSGSTLRIFVNGSLESSTTYSTAVSLASSYIGWNGYDYSWDTRYFNGYISNLRVIKGTAVYTSNFTTPTAPLTAISGTSLLTCQSPTIVDNSANRFTITGNGNARVRQQNPFGWTTSTPEYSTQVYGSSAYFDGTDDKLTIANYPGLAFGTNDFTIQAWFYTVASSLEQVIATNGWSSYAPWLIRIDSGNTLRLNISTSGGGWDVNEASLGTVATNQWYHVAVTRKSGTIRAFVNGIQQYTTTLASSLYNGSQALNVAGRSDASVPLKGYLTDMQLVNGTALYTSNFVPPQAPLTAVQNTTLLLNMDRAAISDKSGKVNLETVGDSKLSNAFKKYGSQSMYFDGTGDYLTIPTNPLFNFGTGDFTIECWVNSADVSSSQKGFLQTSDTVGGLSTGYTTGITFLFGARQNGASAASQNGGVIANIAGTYIGSSTSVITANTWTHLALVRASGTVTLYVDGIAVGSGSATGNCTGTNLVVGGYYSTGYLYNGYLDDLRITKGYARYTANFTPPTSALLTK